MDTFQEHPCLGLTPSPGLNEHRRGNFEIAKEPELISQQRKVIFKKQVYHSDQYKNWTSMICFVAYSKKIFVPP